MNHKDFRNLDIDSMSCEELVSLNKALITYINTLEQKIEALERAKNNNSKNSSLPPSTDQKPEASDQSRPVEQGKTGKAVNTYNQRQKTGRRPGGQKDRKGKTLTKEQAEELLKNEDVIHQVIHVGKDNGGRYIVTQTSQEVETALERENTMTSASKYGKRSVCATDNDPLSMHL